MSTTSPPRTGRGRYEEGFCGRALAPLLPAWWAPEGERGAARGVARRIDGGLWGTRS